MEIVLTKDAFRLVGFEEDEALLLADKRLFPGYRLLQEYYTLPEKFAFFDLFDVARASMRGGPRRRRATTSAFGVRAPFLMRPRWTAIGYAFIAYPP